MGFKADLDQDAAKVVITGVVVVVAVFFVVEFAEKEFGDFRDWFSGLFKPLGAAIAATTPIQNYTDAQGNAPADASGENQGNDLLSLLAGGNLGS
jgi:hypothetical protein